jgi:hypothetical protein
MRGILCGAVLLLIASFAIVGTNAEQHAIKGDYVEARTASVFAGACHYNGEFVTTGRDAVLAWRITSGSWKGVDLTGVNAVAIVTSEANLSEAASDRKSEIIVDRAASYAQSVALVDALKTRSASALGRVVVVRSAPVRFQREGSNYSIDATGFASLDVKAMPDDLCCVMPQLVWYQPIVPLAGRKVGYTVSASYSGGSAGDSWQRSGENSSFYGNFAL